MPIIHNLTDLGRRLMTAMHTPFQRGASSVIFLGADCPDLTTKRLERAYEQLGSHDIVIGPARDGGYYLLGLKKVHSDLFKGISWGTEYVFRQTMEKAKAQDLTISTLEILSDVDNLDSWQSIGKPICG